MSLPSSNAGRSCRGLAPGTWRASGRGRITRLFGVALGAGAMLLGATAVSVLTQAPTPAGAVGIVLPGGGGTSVPPLNICPGGTATCGGGTSTNPGGSATATDNCNNSLLITATASGGEGTVVVGEYSADPDGPLSSATGEYIDNFLSPGNTFTSVVMTVYLDVCNFVGGNSLDWWTGSAWVPVAGAPGPTHNLGPPETVTVTLGSTTSPTLAQLNATPFAVVDAGAPGAPSGLTATPGDSQASFTWSAPPAGGGAPVTSYTVSCTPSGFVTTSATSATISGLVNGTTYSCSVVATNGVGTGPSSAPVTVTPAALVPTVPPPTGPTPPAGPGPTTPLTGPCTSYTGNAAFVCSLYESLLARAPDAGGLSTWVGQLGSGASRAQVAYDIATSSEFRGDLVESYYLAYLARPADPGGLSNWVGQLASGASDQSVLTGILGSAEFYADSGATQVGFVDALYEDLLGRAPDPGGLASWQALLAGGGGRSAVATGILTSREYRSDLVNAYYEAFLGRAADPGGLSTWVAQLALGGSVESVISGILGSPEYYALST